MKGHLVAPQFGLLRPTAVELNHADERPRSDSTPGVSGPSVIVKRRRLTVAPPIEDAGSVSEAPRTAKVYRLARTPAGRLPELPTIDAPRAFPDRPKGRSSRNAVRKPLLIAHQVLAPTQGGAAPAVTTDPTHKLSDWQRLRVALSRLDETLQSVARAQAAYRALDELLCSLGIGDSPTNGSTRSS